MALLNILERQRNSVASMLSLRGVGHDVAGFDNQHMSWKVLIYDQKGQEILSTLMKVGSLRQHGVTLHMSIDSHRDPISDVPAAYFIEPTEKNLQRLEEDILHRSSRSLPMYRQFYVNFIRPVSSLQLETLARNTSAAGMHTLISQVVDRYTDFVAIGAHTFHLNQPGVFKTLMSHGADLEVEAVIERITVGLESVCRQLTIMPVILCPLTESSPAKVIASRLAGRLRDAVAQAPHMQQWKMVPLVLQDRIADLVPMLQHGWSYQTLLHDVFGLHLNRVTVPGADGGKDSVYDVDATDAFWVQYQNLTFPETATAVDTAMKAFNEEHHKVRASSNTSDLSAALNALPEITEKGRLLMKHTNLASSLLQAVKDRRLDEVVELENSSMGSSSKAETYIKAVRNLSIPVKSDLQRCMLVYLLSLGNKRTEKHVSDAKGLFLAQGIPLDSLKCIDKLQDFQSLMAAPTPSVAKGLDQLGIKMDHALRLKDQVLDGVRRLIQTPRVPLLANDIGKLARDPTAVKDYEVLDPLVPARTPSFSTVVVFVVGGGSFQEAQVLGSLDNCRVVYGSTYMERPDEFVKILESI